LATFQWTTGPGSRHPPSCRGGARDANKIEVADVQGSIHPTGSVKLDKTVRDLKAPTVVASLLYADTIKAHRVVADHIFVRDLQRR
jgi:hypothetical protein